MDNELKPCPFCGAFPVQHAEGPFIACEAEGCPMFMRLTHHEDWNRRSAEAPGVREAEIRAQAFSEAAKIVKEARLDLPDEPHRVWMHGFTVAQDSFVAMLMKLAAASPPAEAGEKPCFECNGTGERRIVGGPCPLCPPAAKPETKADEKGEGKR